MRNLIILCIVAIAALLLPTHAPAGGSDTIGSLPNSAAGPDIGGKGAKNGQCFKDKDGNHVELSYKGKTTGDQDVHVSSGNQVSNTALGTPAGDGGCWESGEMKLNGETYRVNGGTLEHQQEDGSFKDCAKADDDQCAKDDEVEER